MTIDKDALTAEDLNNLMEWAEENDEWNMVGLLINEQWSRMRTEQKDEDQTAWKTSDY